MVITDNPDALRAINIIFENAPVEEWKTNLDDSFVQIKAALNVTLTALNQKQPVRKRWITSPTPIETLANNVREKILAAIKETNEHGKLNHAALDSLNELSREISSKDSQYKQHFGSDVAMLIGELNKIITSIDNVITFTYRREDAPHLLREDILDSLTLKRGDDKNPRAHFTVDICHYSADSLETIQRAKEKMSIDEGKHQTLTAQLNTAAFEVKRKDWGYAYPEKLTVKDRVKAKFEAVFGAPSQDNLTFQRDGNEKTPDIGEEREQERGRGFER